VAGVEKVMGFCTGKEYKSFFTEVALFEKLLVEESFNHSEILSGCQQEGTETKA